MSDQTPQERLEAKIAERAKRRAELDELRIEQELEDRDALDALTVEHGISELAVVPVMFAPGLPAIAVVRCPSAAEVKRYHDTIKPSKKGEIGDTLKATSTLGECCMVHPPAKSELRAALLEKRSATIVDMGNAAIKLSNSRADEEAKR
jgi:hypothetical protein